MLLDEHLKLEVNRINEIIRRQTTLIVKLISDQRLELYEAINDQLIKAEKQLTEEKAKIYKEIEELRDAIQNHKGFSETELVMQKIKEVNVNREEATYEFEFDNMTEFLESELNERRASEYFFVRGIKWYLGIEVRKTGPTSKVKLFSINLYAHNPSESYRTWSTKTKFEITYVNDVPSLSWTRKYKNRFTKSTYRKDDCLGYQSLPVAELIEKGFVKNDRIRVKVHLAAEPLQRHGYIDEDRIG